MPERADMPAAATGSSAACPRVAVLIPCYNEAVTIGKVVDDFRRVLPDAAIWVYDNNSTDETARIAREHGALVRFEPRGPVLGFLLLQPSGLVVDRLHAA